MLTGGEAAVEQKNSGIGVSVAEENRQNIDTIIVLTVQGKAFDIQPRDIKESPPQKED